jgi:energy-coupling factor transporter ATP-binding protein EcfA2
MHMLVLVCGRYRTGRTILLTTHHMDEADILSDRVAIMAQGKVRCVGSPLFLKRHYGGGIAVVVSTPDPSASITSGLVGLFRRHCPRAEIISGGSNFEVTFKLPYEDQPKFASLFADLEKRSADLGVESYGVSASSMQEVFLEVLTRENVVTADDDDDETDKTSEQGASDLTVPFMSGQHPKSPGDVRQAAPTEMRLATGMQLWFMRLTATLLKRKQSAFRDRKAVLSTIVLPALFIWLAMIVATLFPPPDDLPPLLLHSGFSLRQNCAAAGGTTTTQVKPALFAILAPCNSSCLANCSISSYVFVDLASTMQIRALFNSIQWQMWRFSPPTSHLMRVFVGRYPLRTCTIHRTRTE